MDFFIRQFQRVMVNGKRKLVFIPRSPSAVSRLSVFLRFSPQPLKAVEFACFMVKNMNDHRPEIKEHPLPLRQPFDVEGLHLLLFHLVHEMHGDGFDVPVAISVTDQKIMRDAGVFGDVEKHRIFSLLVLHERL